MLVSRGIVRKSQKNQQFQVGEFRRQISMTKSSSVQPGKNAFIDKTISNVIPQVLIPKVPCGHLTAIEILDLPILIGDFSSFSALLPCAQDTSQPFEASLDFLVDEVGPIWVKLWEGLWDSGVAAGPTRMGVVRPSQMVGSAGENPRV